MLGRRVRGAALGAVAAALATVAVTGCSSEGDRGVDAGGSTSAKPGTAARADAEDRGQAAKAGTVGGPGSPCPMPVAFDLAADWKPDPVENDQDDEFATLFDQGPVSLVCEIDAKPAGNIGFLRVWVGADAGDDARRALEAFVVDGAKDREDEAYKETKAGKFTATEVTYLNTSEFLDEPKKERAFAVSTPKGVVIVDLGGFDSEEHEQMLPAYELARKSLRSS